MTVQVLTGRNNEIAKQVAAQACLPPGQGVRDALACDLDALQKLSVAESTLVSWVEEVATSGLPSSWLSSGRHPLRNPVDVACFSRIPQCCQCMLASCHATIFEVHLILQPGCHDPAACALLLRRSTMYLPHVQRSIHHACTAQASGSLHWHEDASSALLTSSSRGRLSSPTMKKKHTGAG